MQPKTLLRNCSLILLLVFLSACSRSAKSYMESAKKYFDSGKYDDAIILYKKAIQKEPKSGEAYYRMALADLKIGKVPDAYQAFSAASAYATDNDEIQSVFADFCFELYLLDKTHPKSLYDKVNKVSANLLAKNKQSYDGLRLKGYIAMADRKPADAIVVLRQADQVKPMQAPVIYPLARALREDHQDEAAEKLALSFLEKNKTFAPMYDLLFAMYSGSGRYPEAEKILIAKADNNPKQPAFILSLAAYYRYQKRFDEMKKTLQRVLDNPKDYEHPHALVGDFYLGQRDVAAAMDEYNEGIKSDPKGKALYQKRIVNTYMLEGKKDEAKATIGELAKSEPKDDDVQIAQATMWVEGGKPADVDAAINVLKPLVDKKPTDGNRHFRLGQAYALKGRGQDAENEWKAAIKNNPNLLPPRIALAELSLQTGHFPATLAYCDEILSKDPKNQGARFLKALALANSGRLDDSRNELDSLLKDAPNSVIAKLAMARLDLLQKNFAEAEKQFAELYKPGQQDLRPLDGLLSTYLARNEPAKALALVQKELAAAPDKPELIARLAELNARTGKYAAAKDGYQQLLAKDPNSPHLNRRLGEIDSLMGDREGAVSSFRKASQADPKDIRTLVELGSLLLANGKKQEALDVFRKSLAINPDQPAILNNVAYLIADLNGDLNEALQLARKGLAKVPNDPHLTDTVGFIYMKQHLTDSALQTFRSVVKNAPESATYRLHLANALLAQGDKTNARVQLDAARMKNPTKDEESEIQTLLQKIGQ